MCLYPKSENRFEDTHIFHWNKTNKIVWEIHLTFSQWKLNTLQYCYEINLRAALW